MAKMQWSLFLLVLMGGGGVGTSPADASEEEASAGQSAEGGGGVGTSPADASEEEASAGQSAEVSSTTDKVILINESKTWEDALNYCREKHCDLVSITNAEQQKQVEEKARKANTNYVWLGLRYTCVMDLWFWVNDNVVCYQN